jgi:hypothetical protein
MDPTMKQIEIIPGLELDQVLKQLTNGDIVLTRGGHAVALLSEFDDDEMYWRSREQDPEFIASLKKGREEVAQGETSSLEDVKKQLGIE